MALLTTTQAAQLCGVSGRTMLRWLRSGIVQGVTTAGGHWRIDSSDLADIGPGTPHVAGGRLLVVDDDASHRSALAHIVGLLRPELEVRVAGDALAAGLELGGWRPDVVFVDIEMPALDGVEMLRRIRARSELRHLRVAVISGHLASARVEQLAALGVERAHMIAKPISPAALRELLDELVPRHTLRAGSNG